MGAGIKRKKGQTQNMADQFDKHAFLLNHSDMSLTFDSYSVLLLYLFLQRYKRNQYRVLQNLTCVCFLRLLHRSYTFAKCDFYC